MITLDRYPHPPRRTPYDRDARPRLELSDPLGVDRDGFDAAPARFRTAAEAVAYVEGRAP